VKTSAIVKLSGSNLLGHSAGGISTFVLLISMTLYSPAEVVEAKSMGESKFVDVDGIRTRYFEGGQGEAMVLVHGAQFGTSAGSAHNWMPIFPLLAEHFHVFALDKLGMGLTDNPRSDDGYKMQATARHVYRFMEVRGIEKVHLVGHSRGALPVAYVALDHPEMVKTLTFFNSNTLAPGDPPPRSPRPPGPPPTAESIRQRWENWPGAFHKEWVTDEYVETELEIALQPKTGEAGERLEMLRKRFVERNPEKVKARPALAHSSGTGWWLHEVKDETLDRIRAGELKIPTLIIWGFTDPSATYPLGVDLYELISRSVERAELHFFNRSSHFPYQEYPREVTDLMVNFIGSGTE
jgi:2-hydroxy-6-oxonona-2,4-dienedioate hydrolase